MRKDADVLLFRCVILQPIPLHFCPSPQIIPTSTSSRGSNAALQPSTSPALAAAAAGEEEDPGLARTTSEAAAAAAVAAAAAAAAVRSRTEAEAEADIERGRDRALAEWERWRVVEEAKFAKRLREKVRCHFHIFTFLYLFSETHVPIYSSVGFLWVLNQKGGRKEGKGDTCFVLLCFDWLV